MPDPDPASPAKPVIPDLIRNLQKLFQDISMQKVEIPHLSAG